MWFAATIRPMSIVTANVRLEPAMMYAIFILAVKHIMCALFVVCTGHWGKRTIFVLLPIVCSSSWVKGSYPFKSLIVCAL